MMEGLLVVNKPAGMTSHDVVDRVRRQFNIRRVGHAGTLDPMATGVLIVLVGKATKLSNKFIGFDKAYRATLRCGLVTDTADIEGKELRHAAFEHITCDALEAAFAQFQGELEQVPPMYSAVKIKGKKLYELARKGIVVEREARPIVIHALKILRVDLPEVEFHLECSKGTYVRQLAEDIGEVLGCGACISQIERTKVGPFMLDESVALEEIDESHLRDWQG